MKLAITFAPVKDDWQAAVKYAVEAERLGIDMAWTAETWGYDGATPLAYLAAKTSRLRLGTGIIILPQRNPLVLAKELASLDALSGGA